MIENPNENRMEGDHIGLSSHFLRMAMRLMLRLFLGDDAEKQTTEKLSADIQTVLRDCGYADDGVNVEIIEMTPARVQVKLWEQTNPQNFQIYTRAIGDV